MENLLKSVNDLFWLNELDKVTGEGKDGEDGAEFSSLDGPDLPSIIKGKNSKILFSLAFMLT